MRELLHQPNSYQLCLLLINMMTFQAKEKKKGNLNTVMLNWLNWYSTKELDVFLKHPSTTEIVVNAAFSYTKYKSKL